MSFRRSALLIIIVSLLTLHGRPVWADDLADEADLHFKIAAEKYAARDFRGALEHFLVSNRLVPNRNVIFNIARTYEQLQEFPDAFRYYVQVLDLEPDASRRPRIEEAITRIQPNVAVINVTTDPPGATVYINRRDLGPRGNTPRLLGFPAGTYKVIVDLPGYEPMEVDGVEAKVGEQKTIGLKLERIVGRVRIVGETAGASVRIDDASGAPVCTAPCDLTLPPGRHRLYLSQEGYQASEQDVTVVAKADVTSRYRLNPLIGSLVVNTDERDALVEVDGKPMGFTPAVLNVQSGVRKVRISLRGFRAVEQTANVVANQQTRIEVSLRQLEEVEAASRTSEAVEDAPGSVTIIPSQEIRAMGYSTVAEALRGVRGMYTTYDGSYDYAGVRGINLLGDFGNRTLVLLNGHSINDSWVNLSFLDYTARTDLEDVERIEIVRGPGSVLYGTGAFSGVINVVTKGRPTAAGAGIGVSTTDHGVVRGRGSVQLPFGRDSGMWMSVAGGHGAGRDYYFPEVASATFDGNAKDSDHFNVGTVQGRLWIKSLSAQWFLNSRSKAIPNGFAGSKVGDDRTAFRDTRGFLELTLAPQISRQFGSTTRASANYSNYHDTLWYDPLPGQTQLFSKEDYNDVWLLAEQRFDFSPIPELKITVGAEGQVHFLGNQRGVETSCLTDGTCGEASYVPLGAAPGSGEFEEHPFQIGAGYALIDVVPSDRVRISAGARLDYYSTFGSSGPSPRLALIIKPYEGGNLKLTGGRAFRAPSIYELYWGLFTLQIPPESLEPEQVYSGELEFTHRLSSTVSLLGAGYVNYLDNLIGQQGSLTAADPTQYVNTSVPLLVVGGEAELRREWRQGWMASLSYSYARARYQESGDVQNLRRVPNSPEHMGAFKGAVPLYGKALTLATRMTVESTRFNRNVEERNRLGDPLPPQEETDASVIWDVVLSGQVDLGGLHYNVGVYNVADWRYSAPVSKQFAIDRLPQRGRTFLVSANLNF